MLKIYEVYDLFCGERTTYGYTSSYELAEKRVDEIIRKYGPFRLRSLCIEEIEVDNFSLWLDN